MTRITRTLEPRRASLSRIRVILAGLGPIGIGAALALARRPRFTVVGAVDPALAGKPLDAVLGRGPWASPAVAADPSALDVVADVVVHATGSRLPDVLPSIEAFLARGCHVVSTCEGLFHPLPADREAVARLDRAARAAGKAVVAGGVNPGLAMDVLPLTLATAMIRVDAVSLTRILDARTRRIPFQEKVCVGIDPAAAAQRIERGAAGHVGLLNSAVFLAEHFGWPVDRAEREVRPVVADAPLEGPIPVAAGSTAGLEESLVLFEGERRRVVCRLVMAAGAEPVEDRVRLEGDPPLESVVVGGLPGDQATVGQIVNLAARVPQAAPGFRSVADLALPWFD